MTAEIVELQSLLSSRIEELDRLTKEVGPKLQRVGHLRLEIEQILGELERRGAIVPEKDAGELGQVQKT